MTQQPSGWYDDPQDPSNLRYWDGVVWSNHVVPKKSPTVGQSHIGAAYDVGRAADRGHGGSTPPVPPGGQQQGGYPAYQQAPQWQGTQLGQPLPTTPDGVVLSGWWKRVLARIIDGIITWIVALPLTFAPIERVANTFQDYIQRAVAAAEAGSPMPAQPTAELAGPILQTSLTVLAIYLVYEIAFLTTTGATLGRRVVGISVRLRDRPGPPPLVAVLKRTAVKEGGNLVGALPVLGFFGSLFWLLDSLWPLWDPRKQAIHDKAAATNVVVGAQPRAAKSGSQQPPHQ